MNKERLLFQAQTASQPNFSSGVVADRLMSVKLPCVENSMRSSSLISKSSSGLTTLAGLAGVLGRVVGSTSLGKLAKAARRLLSHREAIPRLRLSRSHPKLAMLPVNSCETFEQEKMRHRK